MKNVLEMNGVEAMRVYRAPGVAQRRLPDRALGCSVAANQRHLLRARLRKRSGHTRLSRLRGPLRRRELHDPAKPLRRHATWSTRANNSIIGPQIGLRWERQRGRWVTSFESRLLGAANFQNITQKTSLGTQALTNKAAIDSGNVNVPFIGIGTNSHQSSTVFAPGGRNPLSNRVPTGRQRGHQDWLYRTRGGQRSACQQSGRLQ